jgi:hypothetical protein
VSVCDTIATYRTGCAHSHSLLMATRFSEGVLNQSWTPGSVQVITVDGSWRPVLAGTPQSSRRYSDVQRRKEQTFLSLPHSSMSIAGRQMFRIRFVKRMWTVERRLVHNQPSFEVRHPARTGFVIDTIQTCATPQGNAGQRILPDTARRTAMFSELVISHQRARSCRGVINASCRQSSRMTSRAATSGT